MMGGSSLGESLMLTSLTLSLESFDRQVSVTVDECMLGGCNAFIGKTILTLAGLETGSTFRVSWWGFTTHGKTVTLKTLSTSVKRNSQSVMAIAG